MLSADSSALNSETDDQRSTTAPMIPSVAAVEVSQALAVLLLASPYVEAATAFDYDDEPLGSVGVSSSWAAAAMRAGRTLLEDAAELRADGGEATQVHASLADGDVFV